MSVSLEPLNSYLDLFRVVEIPVVSRGTDISEIKILLPCCGIVCTLPYLFLLHFVILIIFEIKILTAFSFELIVLLDQHEVLLLDLVRYNILIFCNLLQRLMRLWRR